MQYSQIKELLPHLISQISCMKCGALYNRRNFKIVSLDRDQRSQPRRVSLGADREPEYLEESKRSEAKGDKNDDGDFDLMQFDNNSSDN